ncbi:hypothetical protein WY02_25900 [Pseudonocardia sp. AL041005-10]|nr:hypothetical protein [Pseudonocardia sp. AL041005-10]ALE81253.1 hypothetical protein WY02_25900 [Pseudonocardia sp. AL041005-10]
MITGACERYGYSVAQVEVRLYVGKFAGPKRGDHERAIRRWAGDQVAGSGPIKVFGLDSVSTVARELARSKTYRDNAALMTVKVLDAAGMLRDEVTQTASPPGRPSKTTEINAE